MNLKPETLRARFAELSAQRAAILKTSDPLREKRDKHVQKARATEDQMTAEVKAAETGLFDIDQEIAMIARALGGKTAEPVAEQAETE